MMHHIVCDWASIGILWRELSALYEPVAAASALSCLPCRFSTAITPSGSDNNRLAANLLEDLAYWEENLRGAPPLLELPADRPRPAVIPIGAQSDASKFRSNLTLALRDCCRQEGVSLFTVFAAAVNTLLYRYTGQEDILIGIPIADRDRPELQS